MLHKNRNHNIKSNLRIVYFSGQEVGVSFHHCLTGSGCILIIPCTKLMLPDLLKTNTICPELFLNILSAYQYLRVVVHSHLAQIDLSKLVTFKKLKCDRMSRVLILQQVADFSHL